jgi:hypothetical protein
MNKVKHIGIYIFAMLIIWGIFYFFVGSIVANDFIGLRGNQLVSSLAIVIPFILNIILIVLLYIKKYNLWVLQLSHFIFSVFFFFANVFLFAGSASAALGSLVLTFFIFGSFTLIALVVSSATQLCRAWAANVDNTNE